MQALRAQRDGRQRGVDLVGDAGGELADVGQAAGALHALLVVAAVAHVLEDDHEPAFAAVAEGGDRDLVQRGQPLVARFHVARLAVEQALGDGIDGLGRETIARPGHGRAEQDGVRLAVELLDAHGRARAPAAGSRGSPGRRSSITMMGSRMASNVFSHSCLPSSRIFSRLTWCAAGLARAAVRRTRPGAGCVAG